MKLIAKSALALVMGFASVVAVQAAEHANHMKTQVVNASMDDHAMHGKMEMGCATNYPFVSDFNEQMATMHQNMMAFSTAKGQDEAFIKGMIPHHQGAIEMAKTLTKYSKDKELLKLANDIITSQEKEVGDMQKMLASLKNDNTANIKDAIADYTKINNTMHSDMMAYCNYKDVDSAFMAGMIPHHQGAIDMAKTYLKYGKNPELKTLCENIIKAQTKEIAFMQAKLQKLGAK